MLGHERPPASHSDRTRGLRGTPRSIPTTGRCSGIGNLERQADSHPSAFLGLTLELDRTAMIGHDALGDGQTEPGTPLSSRVVKKDSKT